MKLGIAVAGLAALVSATPVQERKEGMTTFTSKEVKWVDAPDIGKGAATCVQYGDPAKGPHVNRLRFPAGVVRAPHWHSADECVTVISGRLLIGQGETIDEKQAVEIDAGGYFIMPARVPHWLLTKVDAVFTVFVNGPRDVNYIKK